jgi:enoyl-CoA hydratase
MFDLHHESRIATLTLKHGKVNAMDLEFLETLSLQLESLAADPNVGVLILSTAGTTFSAGVDLKRLVAEPLGYNDRFLPAIRRLFRTAFEFPKPLVGAIRGHALAGGCVLASCCDYRLLGSQAKIGMPELRVGLPLPPEGIEILRFVSATQHLQRIVTSGRTYVGPDAVHAGLADEVLPTEQVLPRAQGVAMELQAVPASVFALSKRQIRRPIVERICRHESRFESEIERLWRDEEVRDNVRRFVAERL